MINSEAFWKEEADALLLSRNANYLTKDTGEAVISRAKAFEDLIESFVGSRVVVELKPDCKDAAALRIFKLDAERTFKSSTRREQMVLSLQSVWHEVEDYHQGLGFVVAFLLLFLPPQSVANICGALHRHYIPGYFKAAPAAYVRDAKVFWKMVEKRYPHVAKQLEDSAPPEAFCSKWFVGQCVHVLPFKPLMLFLETLLTRGGTFLFQFGLALIKCCEKDLMATDDVSKILAILRLDVAQYPNDKKLTPDDDEEGTFYLNIVEEAINMSLDGIDLEALRKEVLQEMEEAAAKRKQREAEMEDSDEIVFSDEEEDEEEHDEEEHDEEEHDEEEHDEEEDEEEHGEEEQEDADEQEAKKDVV